MGSLMEKSSRYSIMTGERVVWMVEGFSLDGEVVLNEWVGLSNS